MNAQHNQYRFTRTKIVVFLFHSNDFFLQKSQRNEAAQAAKHISNLLIIHGCMCVCLMQGSKPK